MYCILLTHTHRLCLARSIGHAPHTGVYKGCWPLTSCAYLVLLTKLYSSQVLSSSVGWLQTASSQSNCIAYMNNIIHMLDSIYTSPICILTLIHLLYSIWMLTFCLEKNVLALQLRVQLSWTVCNKTSCNYTILLCSRLYRVLAITPQNTWLSTFVWQKRIVLNASWTEVRSNSWSLCNIHWIYTAR